VGLDSRSVRWLPLTWQVGGTLLVVASYVSGVLSIVDVGGHIALLSLITAFYLSWVVRTHRQPQDTIAVLGYLLYAAGLGFVSAPSLFALDVRLTTPTRALGGLCLGLVLAVVWVLHAEFATRADKAAMAAEDGRS